jgi:hypothetical protein
MILVAPALDALSDHLQNPLTQALMGVTFMFGFIRTRWYWVVIFALLVAVSNVLADYGWTIRLSHAHQAGESALRMFLANGTLMLMSFAIGYGFKMLLLLISGPSPPRPRDNHHDQSAALPDVSGNSSICSECVASIMGPFRH